MRLVVELPDELHRRTKVKAAQEGSTVSEVVRSLLARWALAEGVVASGEIRPIETRDAVPKERSTVHRTDAVKTQQPAKMPDLSKAAQAKGKMGR